MSVEAISIALHHSQARGTAKLVLLGIANHAGDGGAWPAVATLAKYAGITDRRRIQRVLAELEEKGEIKRYIGAGGDDETTHSQRPNLYRFTLTCPADCDRSTSHRKRSELPVMFDDTPLDPAVHPAVDRPPHPRGRLTAPPRSVDRAPRGRTTARTVLEPPSESPIRTLALVDARASVCPTTNQHHRLRRDGSCADCEQMVIGKASTA